MRGCFTHSNFTLGRKVISGFTAFVFSLSLVAIPATRANAQYISNLPKPGEMVLLSPTFEPPVLKGLKIDPANPLHFNFMVDIGQDRLAGAALKKETDKLIKYYLSALTTPDNESWVNLSPYEGDRIIPEMLAVTEMGKDMLEQDYLLKQLSASLTNPDTETGKKFWNLVYKKAYEKFGTTEVPISTFNKVWIVPGKAEVLEDSGTVYIGNTYLKVMLDQDYLAVKENLKSEKFGSHKISAEKVAALNEVSSEVVREIIIPQLEKEVNTGKNFAKVRQIYNSVVLAIWYKDALKESLLGKVYVDQQKIHGIDDAEKDIKQKVYDQYLEAFRKGVYNLVKEDYDLASKETMPRKYFSGGLDFQNKIRQALERNQIGYKERAAARRIVQQYETGNLTLPRLEEDMMRAGVSPVLTLILKAELVEGRIADVSIVLAEKPQEAELIDTTHQKAQGVSSSALEVKQQLRDLVKAPDSPIVIRELAEEYYSSFEQMSQDAFIEATARRTGHTVEQVRNEMTNDIYKEFARQLTEMKTLLTQGLTNPNRADLTLRLSTNDQNQVVINSTKFKDEKGNPRAPRVLYWPMKGDPWQAGHFWVMLEAIVKFKVDKVVIGIDNSDPDRKPDLSSLAIREAVTKAMIDKYLKGFVEYTTIAKEDPKLFTADGETMIFSLMNLNRDVKNEKGEAAAIDWYYGAGSDHAFLYIPRKNEVKSGDFISLIHNIDLPQAEKILAALKEARFLTIDGKIAKGALKPYGLKGNSIDIGTVLSLATKLNLNLPVAQFIYNTLFAKDTIQKVADNRQAADMAKVNMTIIFSQRPGEEVNLDLLRSYESNFDRLNLGTITQIPDGSSTRVRKEGNWTLTPYWQFIVGSALKLHRWGSPELSEDMRGVLDSVESKIKDLVEKPDALTEDSLRDLAQQMIPLSGEGINLLDGFVVRSQLSYKLRDGRLSSLEITANEKLNQIREVVFAVANEKVQAALAEHVDDLNKAYAKLTGSSAIQTNYTIKGLTNKVMAVVNAKFETPLARQVVGNLIQDLVDQANNATVETLYKHHKDYEHDREAAEEFINWVLLDVGPRIDTKLKVGTINPEKAAWITFDDRHKGVMPEASEKKPVKVAVFATSGNPIQLAHIGQILNAIANGADFGLIVLQGTDKRKPDLLDMNVRAEILENSLLKALYPFIYLSYINEDGQGLDGEENILRLSERNRDLTVDWQYMYGQDHNFRTTWLRKGLSALSDIYFQADRLKAAMQTSGLFMAPDGKVNDAVIDMVVKSMIGLATQANAQQIFSTKENLLVALNKVEDHHMVQYAVKVFRQQDPVTKINHFDMVFKDFDFSKFLNYFNGQEGLLNIRLLLQKSQYEPGEADYQEDAPAEVNRRFTDEEVDTILAAMADLKPYAFENVDTFKAALNLHEDLAKKFTNKKVLERIFFSTAIWDTIMRFEEAVAGRATIRGQEVPYEPNDNHSFTIVAMPRDGENNPLFSGPEGVVMSKVKGIESVPVPGFAGAAATGIRVNGNWLWTTHSIYLAICDYVRNKLGDNEDLYGVDKLRAGKPNMKVVDLRTEIINKISEGQTSFPEFRSPQYKALYQSLGLTDQSGVWTYVAQSASSALSSNEARQNASSPVGGIDFDPSLLKLQIKRNGQGVPLPLPEQNLQQIHIDGLYPVILNIQPATLKSFPFLLSANPEQNVPELSMR